MILYAQDAFGLTADSVKSVSKHFNFLFEGYVPMI